MKPVSAPTYVVPDPGTVKDYDGYWRQACGPAIPADRVDLAAPRAVTGELHHHAFTREDGSTAIVIWNRTTDDVVKLTLPRAGRFVEYGLDGTSTEHALKDLSVEIRLQKGLPRVFELR